MKRILALTLSLLLSLTPCLAETLQDYVLATVNGEDLLYSEYLPLEAAYLYQLEAAGANVDDPAFAAYFQDLALSHAIEQMLVRQDMKVQSCYDFDAETEAWFLEQGKAAYAAALQQVKDSLRSTTTTEDELDTYALAYAASMNVTEQTYVDFYRDQYASAKYYEWLIGDNPITDADIQTAYDDCVAESKSLYENDIPAFETAMNSGSEVWYMPAGYRSVLQIFLPATGNTAEAQLASVQPQLDDIYARLDKGEPFQSLIAEYGADANLKDEAFLAAGYQVHERSVIWEASFVAAAFSQEMAQPGCWSQPVVSSLGVHILYYLCDTVSGPVALTDSIREALSYRIYTERYTAAQAERIDVLAESAEIVIH